MVEVGVVSAHVMDNATLIESALHLSGLSAEEGVGVRICELRHGVIIRVIIYTPPPT